MYPSTNVIECKSVSSCFLKLKGAYFKCRSLEAVSFMLPALSQITTELDGCKALVLSGAHQQVSSILAVSSST